MTEIRTAVSTAFSYGTKAIGLGLAALVWTLIWASMTYKGVTNGELVQAVFGGLLVATPFLIAAYRLYEWSELDVDVAALP